MHEAWQTLTVLSRIICIVDVDIFLILSKWSLIECWSEAEARRTFCARFEITQTNYARKILSERGTDHLIAQLGGENE